MKLIGNDGVVSRAELSDGTMLEIDFAIVGVGIFPVIDIAKDAGLSISDGITVNALGQTSDPSIWAVGDCCSFPYKNGELRLESVPHAIDQAESVAQNIMGANVDYVPHPWFWSDQYNVKLQITGLNSGFDEVVTRLTNETSISFWYYKANHLIAVDAMNDPRAYMVAKRLIEAGKTADASIVANPLADLRGLLQ